ncbi:AAA family ATPase [Telmatospirillum siberiense]|uniref:Exonuclease SbcC n=1 Tax=Telmatospirillum siberiense TaxID=382514 RepID=A0A2N3PQP0_9PROT|nr:AAA family ATPase [Telmatospirillum siberiense]PKU22716.1 exonuclease SbcC [Telmatospirillum siberiense]
MRILAIRGENLASLAAPFELNLVAEPLGGAGLFAVTGETGSGKSTILDALCLALYDQYPRGLVGHREQAPDPGGEPLSIQDGRVILRRGAGRGYAEVDFTGQDGIAYRVRWEANRARGKANGKLQNVQRSLLRLSDGGGVAAGKKDVSDAVERLTALTFEQFRRTVLLAQNDFDAFLAAAEKERAELLEKITGTEIYATISIKVREGRDARKEVVDRLEQRRRDVGLLDDNARKAKEDDRSRLQMLVSGKSEARTNAAAQLTRLDAIGAARAALEQAELALIDARSRHDGAMDDREFLGRLDEAEPFRPFSVEVKQAKADQDLAAGRLARLGPILQERQHEDKARQTALSEAIEAERQAERRFEAFGPQWSAAEGLDAEIVTAQAEYRKARDLADGAVALHKEKEIEANDLEKRVAENIEALNLGRTQLAEGIGKEALAAGIDDALELVKKYAEIRASLAASDKLADEAKEKSGTLRDAIEHLTEELDTKKSRRNLLVGEITDRRNALAGIGEAALQTRGRALTSFAAQIRRVLDLNEQAVARTVRKNQAIGEITRADADIVKAKQRISDGGGAEARHTAARAAIAGLAELADETVSAEAIHLRSLLIDGEDCPVCGAKDHPHVGKGDALAKMVETIRARRRDEDSAIQAAQREVAAGEGDLARAEARRAEAVKVEDAAGLDIQRASNVYAEMAQQLSDGQTASGIAGVLPLALGADAVDVFSGFDAAITEAIAAVTGPFDEARRLRGEIDGYQREIDGLDPLLETMRTNIQKLVDERHAADLQTEQASTRNWEQSTRLESIGREILPYLQTAGLALSALEEAPSVVAKELRDIADAYRRLRTRLDALEEEGRRLGLALATAASALDAAKQASEIAAMDLAKRREAGQALRKRRDDLLGGEATGVHRSRISDDWEATRTALARAREAQTKSAQALAETKARVEEATTAGKAAKDRLEKALADYSAVCTGAGIEAGKAETLLAIPAERRTELRNSLAKLDRDMEGATLLRTQRADDLALLREDFDESLDREVLAATIKGLTAEIDEINQILGGISHALHLDDEARLKVGALSEEIETAMRELAVWQAVDAAIGSATGDRFRRFVQGITLDHLLALANDHLSSLSPRYRLSRGTAFDLAINIIDQDMGDEIRTTRSLSGGERFLVSLALALALSGLEGRGSFVDTLFIDEGFGSLDAETLDVAVDALETLQGYGRRVGVVTHVAAMVERISVQVKVEKRGSGRSVVEVRSGGVAAA